MNELNRNRRQFLKAVGVAGAASIIAETAGTRVSLGGEAKEKLAIDGGTPVRKSLLSHQAYGPQFYNETEKRKSSNFSIREALPVVENWFQSP